MERMPKLTVTRIYHFEAAHHLPDHKGKCRNPHGHSYRLELTVGLKDDGEVLITDGSSTGMLIDFGDIDYAVEPLIRSLDHKDLNVELADAIEVPTAEMLAIYIWHACHGLFQDERVHVMNVRLYETEKAYAEVSRA